MAEEWPRLGMTVDELAESLRVDRKSVFQAIKEDGLPARKVGRGWRISPWAVEVWLSNGVLPGAELLGELVEAKKKLDHERELKRERDKRHRPNRKKKAEAPESAQTVGDEPQALDDQLGLIEGLGAIDRRV